jgi:hypothetical protein
MAMDKAMLAALMPNKPEKIVSGIHSILYGDPKSGKTTTLDDPNLRVLLLDMEGGDSVLEGSPNVDIVKITSLEHLNAYLELIKNGTWLNYEGKIVPLEHGLVAGDSITALTDLVKSYVVRVVAPSRKREITDSNLPPVQRFGAQSDWGNFGTIIVDIVKFVHNLTKRGDKSINFMWIAHKDNKYENPNAETMVTGTQIKMQGSSVPVVMSVVDAIFYMNKGVIENPKTKEKQLCYWIQTETIGVTEAGVRQSKRAERLKPRIFNPVWSDIFVKLGYRIDPPVQKAGK